MSGLSKRAYDDGARPTEEQTAGRRQVGGVKEEEEPDEKAVSALGPDERVVAFAFAYALIFEFAQEQHKQQPTYSEPTAQAAATQHRQEHTEMQTTTVMMSVEVVLREHDGLASCLHIALLMDEYLDQSHKWTIARAACSGYSTLIERLGARKQPINERQLDWAMRTAADKGDLRTLQWLSAYRPQYTISTRVMDSAAFSGHLHVVQWLHANRNEGCSTHAMDSAAACGHLEIVQWLHANRNEGCTTAAMDSAAAGGHLKVLQWLAVNRREGCSSVAVNFALFNGHLDVVKWLEAYVADDSDDDDDAVNAARPRRWRRARRMSSFHAYERRSNSRRGSFSIALA